MTAIPNLPVLPWNTPLAFQDEENTKLYPKKSRFLFINLKIELFSSESQTPLSSKKLIIAGLIYFLAIYMLLHVITKSSAYLINCILNRLTTISLVFPPRNSLV